MAWGAAWGAAIWRFEAALDQARRAMATGDYRSAGRRLAELSARRAGRAEVDYLLGVCEQAMGRPEAALEAFGRVPADSPFASRAALPHARLSIAVGRFAGAEEVLLRASRGDGPEAFEARGLLAGLLLNQGRLDEARRRLEDNLEALSQSGRSRSAEAVAVLRDHITLDLFPLPVEQLRAVLDEAARKAPDDDRVWLARANLGIRAGQFDEAEVLLGDCLRRRPDDPAAWMAVLDWAVATDRDDRARQALAHIPADGLPASRVARLRARFAARRGDAYAERRALERAVEVEGGDVTAIELLAGRAVRDGDQGRAAALRRRKAELDEAVRRYRELYNEGKPTQNAREMARLAGRLGRRFEARAFLDLAAPQGPRDVELEAVLSRPDARGLETRAAGRTLADLLADELGTGGRWSPVPGRHPARSPEDVPIFRDEARSCGLVFEQRNGESAIHQLPEMACGGVGLIDYDGDGWLDVYCVQGGPFPPGPDPRPNEDRLFRNRGDGSFEDATAAAGIAAMSGGFGHGVAVGDVDDDNHPDLLVTRWRSYALYRNRGDGTFEDATAAWGLGGDRDWPTSAAFADLDGDGDLDLYVCHYLVWDPEHPEPCRKPGSRDYITCDPHRFPALPDRLYRNDGGRFVDVTAASGLRDDDGRGLGVLAADLDEDGRIDLFVANDGSANFLLRNLGGFRFAEVGGPAGVASSADGGYQAGMGVACGDLDADGRLDLVVTNFYGEATTFYQNLGGGLFGDRTAAIGLAAPSRYLLGFGVAFLDANADGRLDLMTANGHVSDFRPQAAFAMPAQLLLGGEDGRLIDRSARAGPPFRAPHVSRGLATGDLDNDGRVDAVVIHQNEPLSYFHNLGPGGHFVTLGLEGTASPRDGVGARVTLESGGRTQVAVRLGGGSYQSAGDPRLHFGLGTSRRIDRLEVRWPSGRVDRYHGLAGDTGYLLREGSPEPRPLPGWAHATAGPEARVADDPSRLPRPLAGAAARVGPGLPELPTDVFARPQAVRP
jgi:thioredoxin-like negative regulator of GroEL